MISASGRPTGRPASAAARPSRGREGTSGAEPGAGDGVPVRLQGRLAEAGVTEGLAIAERKPEWLRSTFRTQPGYLKLKHTIRDLGLVTVCEEAGCPNISECWADGTATFMINGERCTRACGFCLVDTRHPLALDPGEPDRVAEAVERMGLRFAVVTAVARDDLADGGAGAFAATIAAIRRRTPERAGRGAHPRLQGRRGVAGHDLRRPPRRAQPQHRDRAPPAARRAALGRLRPQPGGAGPGQGRGAGHQVGPHRGHGRDRRRGARRPSPTSGAWASTS